MTRTASSSTSAVVKANYTRDVRNAQGSARYYAQRADDAGERQRREAFGKESDALSQEEVNERLEAAGEEGGQTFYRLVMSPGTEAEPEGDLKSWTRDVMAELEAQHGSQLTWAGYEHAGDDAHSGHAHVHVVVATDRKLGRDDLNELRKVATEAWERQQAFTRELEHDPMGEELHAAAHERPGSHDHTHDYTRDHGLEEGLER